MRSIWLYFKLLFSDDQQLIAKWNLVSDGKYKGAVAKELQKRGYRCDADNWVKSST